MVDIDPNNKRYIITFKRKDQRPNTRDDKLEIFRQAIGLGDVRDILDLGRYTGNRADELIRKTKVTITDINSYNTPFIMARLSDDQVARLRRNPNVLMVEEDGQYYAAEEFIGWQVPKLKADVTWAAPLGVRGAGVNVAVIDTGCDPHLDINSNLKRSQNFTTRPGTAAEDGVHHGTHVCGITGALQGNNEGIAGIAPNANIWNLRAGDNQGIFQFGDIVEALTYAQQNGAHIINMSLAANTTADAVQTAINSCFSAGIVLCGAAGNTGRQETAMYPAAHTNVIGVSNLAANNALSITSSWGSYVDVTAPGRDIQSLAENNLYRVLDGTSMACPSVAGVCALMWAAGGGGGTNPCPPASVAAAKNQTIEQTLYSTATKAGLSGAGAVGQRDIRYGMGLPQADAAVSAMKGVV